MRLFLNILHEVCIASDYELLQLSNVDCIAFSLIDFLDNIPQNLNFFFFCPDLVTEVIEFLTSIGVLCTTITLRLQQNLFLKISDDTFFIIHNSLKSLNLLQLLCHHLVQFLNLSICSLLSFCKFRFESITQLTYLFVFFLL